MRRSGGRLPGGDRFWSFGSKNSFRRSCFPTVFRTPLKGRNACFYAVGDTGLYEKLISCMPFAAHTRQNCILQFCFVCVILFSEHIFLITFVEQFTFQDIRKSML